MPAACSTSAAARDGCSGGSRRRTGSPRSSASTPRRPPSSAPAAGSACRHPGPGRVKLLQGALTYRDHRLAGFDAAAVVEVVEHIDPHRLPAFEEAVFRVARPGTVVHTTPNRDYNSRFATLAAGPCGIGSPLRVEPGRVPRWARTCPAAAAIRSASSRSAEPIRNSARRPRWEFSPDAPEHPGFLPGGPDRAVRQVDLRGAVPADRDRLVRCLPRPRRRRQDRPDGHARRLRSAPPDRGQTPRGAPLDRDRRHQCTRRGPAGTGRAGRAHYVLAVAIVFDVAEEVCHARNRSRPDRQFGQHVVRNPGCGTAPVAQGLGRGGSASSTGYPPRKRRKRSKSSAGRYGPTGAPRNRAADIIGDVHGCHDELVRLLQDLGYSVEDGPEPHAVPPPGRKAIFSAI